MCFIQKQLKGDFVTFAAEVCFEVQPAISFLPEHLAFVKWRDGGREEYLHTYLLKTHKLKTLSCYTLIDIVDELRILTDAQTPCGHLFTACLSDSLGYLSVSPPNLFLNRVIVLCKATLHVGNSQCKCMW